MGDLSDWNIIYAYTRAQAIADGVLIDVTDTAEAMGFKVPVAVTANLFDQFIQASEALIAEGQTTEARLRDVLMLLLFKIKLRPNTDRIYYDVSFAMAPAERNISRTVKVLAVIGPGDSGEPVLTIMLPEDD